MDPIDRIAAALERQSPPPPAPADPLAHPAYVWRDDMFTPTEQIELRLRHGSMLVLGPRTNEALYHSVRKPTAEELAADPSLAGVRVSLTFRKVTTFVDADGSLHGQGAAYSDLTGPAELRGAQRLAADVDRPLA